MILYITQECRSGVPCPPEVHLSFVEVIKCLTKFHAGGYNEDRDGEEIDAASVGDYSEICNSGDNEVRFWEINAPKLSLTTVLQEWRART